MRDVEKPLLFKIGVFLTLALHSHDLVDLLMGSACSYPSEAGIVAPNQLTPEQMELLKADPRLFFEEQQKNVRNLFARSFKK